ncbi:hypothetical protein GCM10010377_74770 [Streptomyces viridiviolaceus]|uniref:DUF4286 family protein n=1 Tax=Streptomyces viridiviolaceus TaxID=68282 RepID=A0ABW2ECN7_9ACTN|nr:DUF4286 family protein [Streptomyces viridiviolaceus]GHB73376.1 hypothetical protein GCM10010377_74770 [Streptomyces viridiviolaceus]
MPKYTYVVLTNPVDGKEDEFNDWYTNTHVHDALKVPGFVAAQRFKLADAQRAESPYPWRYLAIYELETDDLQKSVDALAERFNTPAMVISEALHPERLGLLFEAMTPRLEAQA